MATPTVYVLCDQNCKYESMTREQILSAIMQAVNDGTISNIDAGFITTVKTINGVSAKFFVGTQSDYDALSDTDKNNLFTVITNDNTIEGINEAIEQLQTNYSELSNGLDSGSIVVAKATNATNATNDGDGNKIDETYLKEAEAPYFKSVVKLSEPAIKGFDNKIVLGNLPTSKNKNLSNLFSVSFNIDVYDDTNENVLYRLAFQGQKTKNNSIDANGNYARFHCVGTCFYSQNDYEYMLNIQIEALIYLINGKLYFVIDSWNGFKVIHDTVGMNYSLSSPHDFFGTHGQDVLTNIYLYFS